MDIAIFLDTNIYRSLGHDFTEHHDYKALDRYCRSAGSELYISYVVFKEYMDYWKTEIIEKAISEFSEQHAKISRLTFFESVTLPDLSANAEKLLKLVEHNMTNLKSRVPENKMAVYEDLMEFLLHNKRENKKDNTRDYLLWREVIFVSRLRPKGKVVLISRDKIFTTDPIFKSHMNKYCKSPIEVYDSIPAFLGTYGFQSESFTEELLLSKIPNSTILKEIRKDIECFPSHVTDYYVVGKELPKVETIEVLDKKFRSYYAHKDLDTSEVLVTINIEVKVHIVYEPENDIELLQQYLNRIEFDNPITKSETFSQDGRLHYNEYIRFVFSARYDEKTQNFSRIRFIDFDPSHYMHLKYKSLLTPEHVVNYWDVQKNYNSIKWKY